LKVSKAIAILHFYHLRMTHFLFLLINWYTCIIIQIFVPLIWICWVLIACLKILRWFLIWITLTPVTDFEFHFYFYVITLLYLLFFFLGFNWLIDHFLSILNRAFISILRHTCTCGCVVAFITFQTRSLVIWPIWWRNFILLGFQHIFLCSFH